MEGDDAAESPSCDGGDLSPFCGVCCASGDVCVVAAGEVRVGVVERCVGCDTTIFFGG
jgi:hypothetical protein